MRQSFTCGPRAYQSSLLIELECWRTAFTRGRFAVKAQGLGGLTEEGKFGQQCSNNRQSACGGRVGLGLEGCVSVSVATIPQYALCVSCGSRTITYPL